MELLYDIHTHVGIQRNNLYNEKIFPRYLPLKRLIESYRSRIHKIVTFPMPGTDTQNTKLSPYELENIELIRGIEDEQVGDSILPFLCIHPRIKVSDQLENILTLMRRVSVFGLKFHTLDTESYIDDLFNNSEIISFCTQYKLPILIHAANFEGYENCNHIFRYAEKYKHINILIAHMMGFSLDFFEQLTDYKYDNLFFDCSPFLGMCKFAEYEKNTKTLLDLPYHEPRLVLERLYYDFPDRLIWGSDQPFGDFEIDSNTTLNFSIDDELSLLKGLSKEMRLKIASFNSERFLGMRK